MVEARSPSVEHRQWPVELRPDPVACRLYLVETRLLPVEVRSPPVEPRQWLVELRPVPVACRLSHVEHRSRPVRHRLSPVEDRLASVGDRKGHVFKHLAGKCISDGESPSGAASKIW